jgi:hypothetical protein
MSLKINSEAANLSAETTPRTINFGCLATGRPALVCRWRRDADGRLACFWEPATDIAPNQQRMAAAAVSGGVVIPLVH